MKIAKKSRITIFGARMADFSAPNNFMEAHASNQLDVVVLKANDQVEGRIRNTEFHGERVENGATWIHGIEGNHVYASPSRLAPWRRGRSHGI